MKRALHITLLVLSGCLVLLGDGLRGQNSFPELVDRAYGPDQDLANGIQFSNQYRRIEGHPYMKDEHFRLGNVSIQGKSYENIQLRYNLYNQKVEIILWTPDGGNEQLFTVPEHMEAFGMEDLKFSKQQFGEGPARFFQVIAAGEISCYIHWNKNLVPIKNDTRYYNRFSTPKPSYYLMIGQELQNFHNRKSFALIFPEPLRKEVLKLMRQKHVHFKRITPEELRQFIDAVAELSSGKEQT
jgi:hypothetical protein